MMNPILKTTLESTYFSLRLFLSFYVYLLYFYYFI